MGIPIPPINGYPHSGFVIIPQDQDAWRNHPDFRNNQSSDNRVYATIGAGPEEGLLVSGVNRPRDLNREHNVFSTPVNLPNGMSENQYIQELLRADSSYRDNLQYQLFPSSNNDRYNSNSYVSGLLGSTGGTVEQLPPRVPGFAKPVPQANFQPQRQHMPLGATGVINRQK